MATGLILAALGGTLPLFATEELNLEAISTVNLLIKQGLEENMVPITRLSTELSMGQRMALYQRHKKESAIPFAVNFLIGGGIGSFLQGDVSGGTVGLLGDLVSLGVIVGGYFMFINGMDEYTYNSYGSYGLYGSHDPSVLNGDQSIGMGLIIGGAIGFTVVRIYQWLRPFSYAKKHNETLENVLGLLAY